MTPENCFTTSILVNGELSDKVLHQRGLRLGDPLSPLLFAIVMDALAACFASAESAGLITPLNCQLMNFNVSLCAGDVFMFLEPHLMKATVAKEVLQLLSMASGLQTTTLPSIPIRCEDLDLASVMTSFSCPLSTFLCTYLSMPLSDSLLMRSHYQPIFDKF